MRKGMFPSVGAMRAAGTTVIIEDVAFPIERLAEATLELQALLSAHGYAEAIIFGHALEGNLHFVFTQDFNTPAEIERYRRFMAALCRMVVEKYDGSLKAEHGTGRNVAPFVELEWGAEAYALMQRIKTLFDPHGLLNPGVIMNDDPAAHLKHLKPLPQCDALVDKCIECGFCEPQCPSRGLTLSPRQRIVGWREITRLDGKRRTCRRSAPVRTLYDYAGIDTCAACGLCATACPVDIETGLLIKSLREHRQGPVARRVATTLARPLTAPSSTGMRAGLTVADLMNGAFWHADNAECARRCARCREGGCGPSGRRRCPRAVQFKPPAPLVATRSRGPNQWISGRSPTSNGSSIFRAVPPARWVRSVVTTTEALPIVAGERLFRKASFEVVYPQKLAALCCGQAFESKGLTTAADRKCRGPGSRRCARPAKTAVGRSSSTPVPARYRMRQLLRTRLPCSTASSSFTMWYCRAGAGAVGEPVAIHPVCSVRKMGEVDKLGE